MARKTFYSIKMFLSKFKVIFITPTQKFQTVTKVLVDKWIYTYRIPSHIHCDNGQIFKNDVIYHLYKSYGVQQMTTTPYNQQGNSICERRNWTMLNLLKTLPIDHTKNWPTYIPSLVFTHNLTQRSTAGYLPYKLMLGKKTTMPCDNCLWLLQYDSSQTTSKRSLIQEHHKMLQYAKKKGIRKDQAKYQEKCRTLERQVTSNSWGNLVQHILERPHFLVSFAHI